MWSELFTLCRLNIKLKYTHKEVAAVIQLRMSIFVILHLSNPVISLRILGFPILETVLYNAKPCTETVVAKKFHLANSEFV